MKKKVLPEIHKPPKKKAHEQIAALKRKQSMELEDLKSRYEDIVSVLRAHEEVLADITQKRSNTKVIYFNFKNYLK